MQDLSESEPYPAELLWGVSWTFRGPAFDDQRAFEEAVAVFQDPDRREAWRPGEIILKTPRIRISPDVHWHLSDEHPTVELAAENGETFTAGELLFKVHNAFVVELRQMDHKYFEGFTLDEDQELDDPPLYHLDLGS